jgi:hypothetical protein
MIDVEVLPAISEPTTPMEPSEAMRLGAMVTRQTRERLWNSNKYAQYACAIGAAATAAGVARRTNVVYDWFEQQFDCAPHPRQCPITYGGEYAEGRCQSDMANWTTIATHLNDYHQLPREWIADYLQSLGH